MTFHFWLLEHCKKSISQRYIIKGSFSFITYYQMLEQAVLELEFTGNASTYEAGRITRGNSLMGESLRLYFLSFIRNFMEKCNNLWPLRERL